MAALPGRNPPTEATQAVLGGIPIHISSLSEAGEVRFDFSPLYAQRLLHTPNLDLRAEALEQIGRAQALFATCLMNVSGHKKTALQLSHLLQQMAQLADIDPNRS